jgi:predicted DsbA family dithiol-disulfide isomerase
MSAQADELLVFIDVICPWCYVGKRRLEKALALVSSENIRLTWLPFELNPDMPKEGIDRRSYRIRKFGSWERSQQMDAELAKTGAQEGLEFRCDLITRTPSTRNAHRLIWLGRSQAAQEPIVEALFQAYFTQGRDIGASAVLADLAAEAGLAEWTKAMAFLQSEEGAAEVVDQEEAAHRAGLTGVPAFILNRRPLLVGAQPADVIASALRRAMAMPAV